MSDITSLNVRGKNAVITGGARGLGYYCSEILIKNGLKNLFISSRNEKELNEARENLLQIVKQNNLPCENIYVFSNNLSNGDGVKNFFNQVSSKTDHIDLLILNSGASWGAPLEKHPEEALRKVIDLNVIGLFQAIQLFKPLLKTKATQSKPSRILIMASVAGLVTSFPQYGTYGYNMSKAAVIHLGKTLAVELGYQNINVNVLCPGFFETKMSQGILKIVGDSLIKQTPRRRLGEKEDMQNLVLFLCDDKSNFLNGIVVPIDGGAHLVGAAAKL